ncbi:LYR motif containing protein 1 isoform X2 [Rhinoraja longicauda]
MTAATRNEVLGLYRRIFRIARTWQSLTGLTDDSSKEKQYIVMEAKALFKKNKNLTDAEAIKNCITECHTRIEMGLHYRIPYPRPVSSNLYIIHACFNFQHLNSSTLSRILKIKGFSKILGKILAKFAWHCTLKQPRCPQALKLHVNTDAPNMETSSGV